MKIAIGEFSHEANTLSNQLADFDRFAPDGWEEPDRLLDLYRDSESFLGGMIRAAQELGVELVPLPTIRDSACPVLERRTYERILSRITDSLARHSDELDGVCFSLHGAGVAQGIDNIEIHMLQAFRREVGEHIPIVCTADLHGNITSEMLGLIQGLFCHKEYPHTDSSVSGELAMRTLVETLVGKKRPMMSLRKLPLLTTPPASCTYASPMKEIKDYFAEYCAEHGLIDTAFFHGFSAADVPHAGASVLVIADGYDPVEDAEHLARFVWQLRERMHPEFLSGERAIDRALEGTGSGYAVINEVSDNVGAGCPGDGTHLLRALLDRNVPHSIFVNLYDPHVAELAHEAGIGARICVSMGGKTDPAYGLPVTLKDVEVLALPQEECCPYTSPMYLGLDCYLGRTAHLRHGNVEIIVTSVRKQTVDDSPITLCGGDIQRYKLVCLKSTNHFRGFFQSRARTIVAADTPGLRAKLHSSDYKRISRPIYPLDPDVQLC